MKYVYYDTADITVEWQAKATKAAGDAAAQPDEKSRQEFIAGKGAIWTGLKPVLERLSDGKCWYSEAKDIVSYWDVDHYRPKKLCPWLAFEWKNFRLSGQKPNRKKTDEFPLEDEARRASAAAPDTRAERPLLLDPVRWGDPDLLAFKADGEPTCAIPADDLAVQRVGETVAALQLDSAILTESRREKWRNCETKLKKLRDLVEQERQRENIDAAQFSRELCRDIAELFDDKAEFRATAKACEAELEAQELVRLARAISQRALNAAA